jgi:hypothetical protein
MQTRQGSLQAAAGPGLQQAHMRGRSPMLNYDKLNHTLQNSSSSVSALPFRSPGNSPSPPRQPQGGLAGSMQLPIAQNGPQPPTCAIQASPAIDHRGQSKASDGEAKVASRGNSTLSPSGAPQLAGRTVSPAMPDRRSAQVANSGQTESVEMVASAGK